MNKKILGVTLTAVFVAMLIAPAMAASPNKTPVTAVITGIMGADPVVEIRVTKGGIEHLEYFKFWGTMELTLEGASSSIPVEWVDVCVGTYNSKNNKGVYKFDEVWTLPGGTFEGIAHLKLEGSLFSYTHMTAHIILHGTGDYEGQILSLTSDDDTSGFPSYAGYWLKP